MKRLLILCIAFLGIAFTSQAQIRYNETFSATLTNTETEYFTLDSLVSKNSTYAIGVTLTEASGTPTVIVKLEHAVELDKWVVLTDADTLIDAGTPNAVSYIFTGTATPAAAYRVALIQTGTASTTVTGRAYFKKNE